jgi:hypothetical protein
MHVSFIIHTSTDRCAHTLTVAHTHTHTHTGVLYAVHIKARMESGDLPVGLFWYGADERDKTGGRGGAAPEAPDGEEASVQEPPAQGRFESACAQTQPCGFGV